MAQVVPGEPNKLKQLLAGAIQPRPAEANNSSNPAGRLVVPAMRLVLADKFGNTAVGAPADKLLLLAEVREAEDSQKGQQALPAGPGEIMPLDVPFLFCNDAARLEQVPMLPSAPPWAKVGTCPTGGEGEEG